MAANSENFPEFPDPGEIRIDPLGHREDNDANFWLPVRGALSDLLVSVINKLQWPVAIAVGGLLLMAIIAAVVAIIAITAIPTVLLLNVVNLPGDFTLIADGQQQTAERIAISIRDGLFGALAAGFAALLALFFKWR